MIDTYKQDPVTRFTRVWIETLSAARSLEGHVASPASRGCGLKHANIVGHYLAIGVTRFTRVWIETTRWPGTRPPSAVTRFTRVWIETPRR